jgi:DNA-binding response OmpR family regulator
VTASIILVEDNPADVALVRRALETHGVQGEITVFTDGEKAIRFIESLDEETIECPDLAIIDLNLPKRSGSEVLQALRQSERYSAVPIVILTSSGATKDRADAARLGASRYVIKPTRLEEFMNVGAVLKEIISRSR